MRKIGIFGGSFNPVHVAHLVAAERARDELGLETVVFVPARMPPHKRDTKLAAGTDRLEMVRLAIAGNAAFAVSDIELRRRGVSYSLETVTAMRKKYEDAELYFLVGADMLHDLATWRQVRHLATLCKFVPISRPIQPPPKSALRTLSGAVGMREARAVLARSIAMPLLEVSSSELRQRMAKGRSVRYLVPDNVLAYAKRRGLYGA